MAVNQQLKRIVESIKYSHRLKQADIAEQLGVKTTYLSDMINGRVPFSDKFKERLFEVYPDCVPTLAPQQYAGGEQSNINGDNINGNNVTVNKSDTDKLLDLLQSKEQSLVRAQEQIDKLLTIIDRLTTQ